MHGKMKMKIEHEYADDFVAVPAYMIWGGYD